MIQEAHPYITAIALSAAAVGQQSYSATLFSNTNAANGVTVADIDRDGLPDAVTIHISGANPTVINFLKGDGAGNLAAPQSTSIGPGGIGLQAVDLNGDTVLDIVTAESNANAPNGVVRALLGLGNGQFVLLQQSPSGPAPRFPAVGDINQDGFLDVVTPNSFSGANSISVLFGTGSGLLAPAVDVPAGTKPWNAAIVDLDADGFPDVATANNGSSSVGVLLNQSGSIVPNAVGFAVGSGPRGLTVGDFNSDGAPDLATSNGVGNTISVLLNSPGSLFQAAVDHAVGTNPSSLVAGDLDRNGTVDIAATNQTGAISNSVSIIFGDGAGGFSAPSNIGVGTFPSSVRLGDMNADGRVDLVVAHNGSANIAVLMNTEATPFGIVPYGVGSAGCFGRLGMLASSTPQLGNTGFHLSCTNAPRKALGLCIVSDVPDVTGSDPFQLGALLHVNLQLATTVLGIDLPSDFAGESAALVPISNDPQLAGLIVFAQALFVEPFDMRCNLSAFSLVSSSAVQIIVQP